MIQQMTCIMVCVCVCVRERQTDRQKERLRERERQRQTGGKRRGSDLRRVFKDFYQILKVHPKQA
jgi:hypothetical protein